MDWVDFITRVLVPIGALITAIVSFRKVNFEGKGVIYTGFEKLATLHQAEIKRLEDQNEKQRKECDERAERLRLDYEQRLEEQRREYQEDLDRLAALHAVELTRVLHTATRPSQEA